MSQLVILSVGKLYIFFFKIQNMAKSLLPTLPIYFLWPIWSTQKRGISRWYSQPFVTGDMITALILPVLKKEMGPLNCGIVRSVRRVGWSSKWSGHHGSTHWWWSKAKVPRADSKIKSCFFQAQCIAVWSRCISKALNIWNRRKSDMKFHGPDWNKTDRLITGSNQASSTALCACASKWPTTNNQEMGGCCISYFSHSVDHFKIIPQVIFSVKFWQKSGPNHWTRVICSYVEAAVICGIHFL